MPVPSMPARTGAARSSEEIILQVASLFASIPVPVLVADSRGQIVCANPELVELLGYSGAELIGRSVEDLVPEGYRARHREHREAFGRAPRARRMGQAAELVARRRDGTTVPVEVALKPLQASDGVLVLGILFDLTLRKRLEAQLREQNLELERRVAERTAALERRNQEMSTLLDSLERTRNELERLSREDSLTGLFNRREFFARARAELRRAQRRGSMTALAMFDIDHFKRVNDTHGHATGDQVLRQVAALMRSHCRLDDVLARYGGEEFVLLLPETALADAAAICERIRSSIESHEWGADGVSLPVTISAGLVQCAGGEPASEALNRADALLYQAKSSGRNRACS
jgi:diguanylate cyclase (GGDEF)-like protein/PAS domain S-box-containing protein